MRDHAAGVNVVDLACNDEVPKAMLLRLDDSPERQVAKGF
jgi:hypothetical protein